MRSLIILTALLLVLRIQAQEKKHEIGLRGGQSSGIFYRGFIDENHAIKGLLTFRNDGMQATALYEKYDPIFNKKTNGFYLYYGIGGHFGFAQWDRRYHYPDQPYSYYNKHVASPVIGLDGIIGIEYRLNKVPLAFGFDYKPFFDLLGEDFFDIYFGDFGFSIKVRL